MLNGAIVAVHGGTRAGDVAAWIDECSAGLVALRVPSVDGASWYVVERSSVSASVKSSPDSAVGSLLDMAARSPVAVATAPTPVAEAPPEGLLFVSGNRLIGYLPPGESVPSELRIQPTPENSAPTRRSGAATAADRSFLYPYTDGPRLVQPEVPFTVEVGVTPDAESATGSRLDLKPDSALDLEVIVSGDSFSTPAGARLSVVFDPKNGGSASATVEVVAHEPPVEVQRLATLKGGTAAWNGEIDFLFLHDGLPVGRARHRVVVGAAGTSTSLSDELEESSGWLGDEPPPCFGPIATTLPEPDLTIVITAVGEPGTGRYQASLRSRFLDGAPVDAAINLGSDAMAFADVIMKTIPAQDGEVFIDETIAGISRVIARTVADPSFWERVSDCIAAANSQRADAPSVLLLTSESCVPWELADIGSAPVAPDAPPLLAAQARVGRWILDDVHCTPMATDIGVRIDRIATVVGEYLPTSGLARLPLAEKEGQYLRDSLGATYVTAEADHVDRVLGARLRDPFQILHFACHGNVTTLGMNALYMNNGKELLHFAIEASAAGREYSPLVFLNACRVGAGQSQLNQYGGFAASFLRAGYSGFIGPLWAVDDTVAHEVATEFYSSLGDEGRPAEILRRIRTRFVASDEVKAPPSTYLAYVFYGHPDLTLSGVGPIAESSR